MERNAGGHADQHGPQSMLQHAGSVQVDLPETSLISTVKMRNIPSREAYQMVFSLRPKIVDSGYRGSRSYSWDSIFLEEAEAFRKSMEDMRGVHFYSLVPSSFQDPDTGHRAILQVQTYNVSDPRTVVETLAANATISEEDKTKLMEAAQAVVAAREAKQRRGIA